MLAIQEGNLESARACLDTALSMARELSDRSIQSEACNGLGNVESVLGRREQALAHYNTALALAREAGNRHREGSVLGNLGNEYAEMGMMDKAGIKYVKLAEEEMTAEKVTARGVYFVPTKLAHDEVVAKRDYMATLLKTSALPSVLGSP